MVIKSLSPAAAVSRLVHVHRPFSNLLNVNLSSSPFALSVKSLIINLSTLFVSHWATRHLSIHGTHSSCHGPPSGCSNGYLGHLGTQLPRWLPLRIPYLATIDTTTISHFLVLLWPCWRFSFLFAFEVMMLATLSRHCKSQSEVSANCSWLSRE